MNYNKDDTKKISLHIMPDEYTRINCSIEASDFSTLSPSRSRLDRTIREIETYLNYKRKIAEEAIL